MWCPKRSPDKSNVVVNVAHRIGNKNHQSVNLGSCHVQDLPVNTPQPAVHAHGSPFSKPKSMIAPQRPQPFRTRHTQHTHTHTPQGPTPYILRPQEPQTFIPQSSGPKCDIWWMMQRSSKMQNTWVHAYVSAHLFACLLCIVSETQVMGKRTDGDNYTWVWYISQSSRHGSIDVLYILS